MLPVADREADATRRFLEAEAARDHRQRLEQEETGSHEHDPGQADCNVCGWMAEGDVDR